MNFLYTIFRYRVIKVRILLPGLNPNWIKGSRRGGQNIIIFAVGLNDSAYVRSEKGNWVDFNEYRANIKKLIDIAGKFSKKIVFVGLYPIDESKMNPMPYDLDKSYSNEDVKKYDQFLQVAAKENGAEYISIFDKFEKNDYKKLLHDGAHPNSAGHELIFETVKDYLLEKKII